MPSTRGIAQSNADAEAMEELLLECLPIAERVTAWVSRRQGFRDDEAEELGSRVRLKLIENDYYVLRRFEGQSRLRTYLTTVVMNLARDLRIGKWGKWRPSAVALRTGPEAVQLETLIYRDGRSTEEAVETLASRQRDAGAVDRLTRLAEELPERIQRQIVGPEGLERIPAPEAADSRVRDAERRRILSIAKDALFRALAEFDVEDRLILQLFFVDGLTLAAIARGLALDQKPLYRRKEKLVGRLHRSLEEVEGLDADDLLEAAGWSGAELNIDIQVPGETESRPSNRTGAP